jgi:hypothetical protein
MPTFTLIAEGHATSAGKQLLSHLAGLPPANSLVFLEYPALYNGIFDAYHTGKISDRQFEATLRAGVAEHAHGSIPSLMMLHRQLKQQGTTVIAYDVRNIIDAQRHGMSESAWHKKEIAGVANIELSAAPTRKDLETIEARIPGSIALFALMDTYGNAPITQRIRTLTRDAMNRGVVNADAIATLVMEDHAKENNLVLLGAGHVNGIASPPLQLYGIVDEALQARGHRTKIVYPLSTTRDYADVAYMQACQTYQVFENHVLMDGATGKEKKTYQSIAALRDDLLKQYPELKNIDISAIGATCSDSALPKASDHKEFGPLLKKLAVLPKAPPLPTSDAPRGETAPTVPHAAEASGRKR